MKDTEYAYAVAHLRAHENLLLNSSDLDQMISSRDASAAMKRLADKGWNINENESVRENLQRRITETYELVYESAPDSSLLRLITVRNDFNNLKAALKSLAADIDPSDCYIYPTSLDLAELKKLLAEKRYSDLPEGMEYVAKKAYDILVRCMDGQRCDICVDKFTLREMQRIAKKADNAFITGYVSKFVALTDIKTAYRCAKMNKDEEFVYDAICGGDELEKSALIKATVKGVDELLEFISKSGYSEAAEKLKVSVQDFEKYVDDEMTRLTDSAKYVAFGIDPLLAYYFAMEASVKCARIILECKKMGVSEKVIRERMREMYV